MGAFLIQIYSMDQKRKLLIRPKKKCAKRITGIYVALACKNKSANPIQGEMRLETISKLP